MNFTINSDFYSFTLQTKLIKTKVQDNGHNCRLWLIINIIDSSHTEKGQWGSDFPDKLYAIIKLFYNFSSTMKSYMQFSMEETVKAGMINK